MTTGSRTPKNQTPTAAGIEDRVGNQKLGWASATARFEIFTVETVEEFENMPIGCLFYVAASDHNKRFMVPTAVGAYGLKIMTETENSPSRDGSPSEHTLVLTRYISCQGKLRQQTKTYTGRAIDVTDLVAR